MSRIGEIPVTVSKRASSVSIIVKDDYKIVDLVITNVLVTFVSQVVALGTLSVVYTLFGFLHKTIKLLDPLGTNDILLSVVFGMEHEMVLFVRNVVLLTVGESY